MSRSSSLAKLAVAYGRHVARRRFTRPPAQLAELLATYAPDGMSPLAASERERRPALIGCINCGLCALAAGRIGRTRLPDLAASYLRLYSRIGAAAIDVEGELPDLESAAAACPVGVPLSEVAVVVRRFAGC